MHREFNARSNAAEGHREQRDYLAGKFVRQPGNFATRHQTSPTERWLLFSTIVLLPLQDHIPNIAGFSILYVMFAILAAYIVINRAHSLDQVWLHPVFATAYGFLFVIVLLESAHPMSDYADIVRFAQMIIGAVIVASLCRDRRALGVCLYGFIVAAVWLSIMLISSSYDSYQGKVVSDFEGATEMRAEAFGNFSLKGNLNNLAAMAAQGGIVSLALAMTSRFARRRNVFLGASAMCFLGSFLTMSRGGVAMSIASCGTMLFMGGGKQGRKLLPLLILSSIVFLMIPGAIWSRMTFSTEVREDNKMESRARVYTTALDRLPEYIMTGVGAGNFLNKWGYEKGFATGSARSINVGGAHNCFLQVTINWGLLGLLGFLAILWQARRCLPRQCGSDGTALALVGLAVSLVLLMLVSHEFYDKRFALGLGMLVAARHWIWPLGIVKPESCQQGLSPYPRTRLS